MRVALLSDLHGNEIALDAVRANLLRHGVDRVVCLGDVATLGPRPGAVLDALRELGCPCILGNHDEFLFNPGLVGAYTEAPVIVDAIDWCRDRLSAQDLDFVRGFQASLEIELDGRNRLFLFHGSPASHTQDLLATTPAEELDRHLGDHRAAVMAGGHTHIQMLRQHGGVLLVNPGSVGLAFKEYVAGRAPTLMDHAEYAVVESRGGAVSVTLQRVPLDRARLRKAAEDSDNPLRGMLMQQYS